MLHRMKRLLWVLLAVSMSFVLPSAALAQSEADKATARELGVEGQRALDAGDFETAIDRFRRAEALFHAPTLMLGLARAYAGHGKYVQAQETYNSLIREELPAGANPKFKEAQELARAEVVGLDAKIAWVTVEVRGPTEPKVTLDGSDVPRASLGVRRAVNPGQHEVRVVAEGYADGSESFEIEAGGEKSIVLTLEPGESSEVPARPLPDGEGSGGMSTLTLVGAVSVGVGGAALIVGAVTGGLALGKHGDLTDACPSGQCPATEQDNLDSYRTLGTVSTIGFIAGGVLAATGVTLLILAPSGDAPDQAGTVRTRIGPSSVSATVSF